MIVLPLLYMGILSGCLISIYTRNIIVGIGADNNSCADCLKFTSLLEGIESSFQSNETVTLGLLDFEYQIREEDIAQYLNNSSNRSLNFKSQGEEKFRAFPDFAF